MNDAMRQWIDEQEIDVWVKWATHEELVQRVERLLRDIRLAKDELKYQHELIIQFEKEAKKLQMKKELSRIIHCNTRARNV